MLRTWRRTTHFIGQNIHISQSRSSLSPSISLAPSRVYSSTALRAQLAEREKEWDLKNFIGSLFAVPKGFRKFYPEDKGGAKGSTSTTTESSTETSKESTNPKQSEQENATFKSKKDKKAGGAGGGKGKGDKKDEDPFTNMVPGIAGSVAVLGLLLYLLDGAKLGKEISWQEFQGEYLEKGLVKKITIVNKSIARVELKSPQSNPWTSSNQFRPPISTKDGEHHDTFPHSFDGNGAETESFEKPATSERQFISQKPNTDLFFTIGSVDSFERKMEEVQSRLRQNSQEQVLVMYQSEQQWFKTFVELLPSVIFLGVIFAMSKGMGGAGGGPMGNIFKIGKSTANMVKKEDMKVTFKDVAGCDEAKKEVMEFVEFLKAPEKFKSLGAKIPRGALLAGPPGTGKTLLAKATAGEANVPFFSISGSDFVEMFVGVGASRVRDLFKEARAHAPCIIFIDEIDAVGRARGKGGAGGHDERENTLNQLLIEMDGFNTDASVIMLAGTNRADMLDSALTRPGRFDRTIAVELPDIKGRKSIFDVHLKNIKLSVPIEEISPRLAALTPGFSGADIANICNEAAIHAGRKNKTAVDQQDFESATDRIIGGLESTRIISPEEKRIVAFHEAGHAVAGWYLEHANPLLKVTIVPRSKGSLGYAQYLPKEISLRTKDQVMDLVCMALAGRAAELVHFGKYTTGASDDLNKVTQIIYQLVQVYGMNDTIGQLAFPPKDGQWPQDRVYGETTAEMMDQEVRDLADKAFKRTVELMETYRDDVRRVAELLIEQETIDHSDIARLIGDRKFSAGKEYDEFVSTKKKMETEAIQTEKSTPVEESPSQGEGVQVGLT